MKWNLPLEFCSIFNKLVLTSVISCFRFVMNVIKHVFTWKTRDLEAIELLRNLSVNQ